METQLKIPILFLLFNRPDTTKQVFDKIKEIMPTQLFIACDGPRDFTEKEKVEEVKRIVLEIDWDCKVKTLFRDKNLGCKNAISTAIDWFFQNIEEGIILEDDCLPNNSFFYLCDELLKKYRNDHKIMHISGVNFQFGKTRGKASYYFSKYNHIWGWATWKRAWKHYDAKMSLWPEILKNKWPLLNMSKNEIKYWLKIFNDVYTGKINTWDYQWTFACWLNNGLSVIPQKNLVSNIGFGDISTHTKNKKSRFSNLNSGQIDFPLKHPLKVQQDSAADDFTFNNHFSPNLINKVLKKLF